MKTVDQLNQEREACRAALCNLMYGPNGDIMREYLMGLLDLSEGCLSDNPYRTHYNCGKLDSYNLINNEALNYARSSKR